ncbi:MAG: hypothetical protein ACREDZ_16080 [Kiloniellales bacterium]
MSGRAPRLQRAGIKLVALVAVGSLAACGGSRGPDPSSYLAARGAAFASGNEVALCHGHGCRLSTKIVLADADWSEMKRLFGDGPAESAADERARIAAAIGLMEGRLGGRAGLAGDRGRNVFPPTDDQLDCIDETLNTTIYLDLLAQHGWMTWHRVDRPAKRGFDRGELWVHETAVVSEIATGRAYVVDSWFHDNGTPPHVVPLSLWLAGWLPGDPLPLDS